MFMHVLPLCQMNQSILWYYTYILLTEHITDDRMFVEDTSAHPSLTGEEEEDKMEFKHIALHPRRQHTILHIYIFCAVFMKLQQGYIGYIILQLTEFGRQAVSIWHSSIWGLTDGVWWVCGLGVGLSSSWDEVEPFLTILPTTDPPSLICYTFQTPLFFYTTLNALCLVPALYAQAKMLQEPKMQMQFCSVFDNVYTFV